MNRNILLWQRYVRYLKYPRYIQYLIYAMGLFIFLLCVLYSCIFLSEKKHIYANFSFSQVITDRNGEILRIGLSHDEKYRLYIPLKNIHPHMIEATLLYEDRSFYEHSGVNFLALGRAAYTMMLGGRRMGASTISMQLVRLSQSLQTNTISGKLYQMWQTLILEHHYNKEEILEAYLTLAPYGANVEGIGAAAQVWFHKKAKHLNIAEILALVTVPQNPTARNPLIMQNKAFSKARLRLNALWQKRYPHALNATFAQIPLKIYSPKNLPFEAPHVVMEMLSKLKKMPNLNSQTNGLTSLQKDISNDFKLMQDSFAMNPLRTTLDLSLQKNLEHLVKRYRESKASFSLKNAAVLLANWRTGEIHALLGSANFFDTSIQGQVDGTLARRSPGSTLKPFIYALALEQGLIHPQTILADTPKIFQGYEPENADGEFRGPVSAQEALQASRNIPAISLASQLTSPDLYDFLKLTGVAFEKPKDYYGLALVLGGAEISMRELANLYASLPNQGMFQPLRLVQRQIDAPAKRILTPEAAYIVLDMLRMPSPLGFSKGRISWKTGTSNGQRDAWAAGIFGPYVLVTWVGNFDASPNPNFTGLHAAAPLFFQIVEYMHSTDRKSRRNYLSGISRGLNIRKIPVCASTGDIQINLCPEGIKMQTWFIPGSSPIKESGILREILVDMESGLRECTEKEGITKRVIREFWPADMRRLFLQAGVHKKPIPPFALHCDKYVQPVLGIAPVIQSPSSGLIYHQSIRKKTKIPLIADVDADVSYIYWFANNNYLGTSEIDEIFFWEPSIGKTTLRVVDDLGRYSSLLVTVESIP